MVRAIGKPPPGSPLVNEPLTNGVVFVTNGVYCGSSMFGAKTDAIIIGRRPVSTCLGGGDLDGDVYNLTPMVELHPNIPYEPATYGPAKRKMLERESTMADVANFVADYITSDVST